MRCSRPGLSATVSYMRGPSVSRSIHCLERTRLARCHDETARTGAQPRPGGASRLESQMQDQATTTGGKQPPADAKAGVERGQGRSARRELILRAALRKRAAGVPTYTVPEAAVLLSVSQEHLYRLIRSDAFPAVDMRRRRDQGRYIVPAKAVEAMLDAAAASGALVSAAEYGTAGGAA